VSRAVCITYKQYDSAASSHENDLMYAGLSLAEAMFFSDIVIFVVFLSDIVISLVFLSDIVILVFLSVVIYYVFLSDIVIFIVFL
jgi:hypothetical protein